MNIQLRGEVLEKALTLEDAVNNLVLLYLGIKKEDRRAVGHKSGTLTYKNLLDLLYDIDVLDKKEFQTLLLLMEVRNQFMHNLACDSFEKAIEFLGPDKGKRLLKFNDIGGNTLEDQYSNSFLCLATDAIHIIGEKIEKKQKDVSEKSTYLLGLLDLANNYDKLIHDKIDTLIQTYTPKSNPQNDVEAENSTVKAFMQIDLLELKHEFHKKFEEMAADLYKKSEYMAIRLIDGRQYDAT